MTLLESDSYADYAITLAVHLAEDAGHRWLPSYQFFSRDPDYAAKKVSVHAEAVSPRLFKRTTWSNYQRLWYWWRAPDDFVSPMQWYLAGLAGRWYNGVGRISERTEAWQQELDSLTPTERVGRIRDLLGVGSDREALVASGDSKTQLRTMASALAEDRPFVAVGLSSDCFLSGSVKISGSLSTEVRDSWAELSECERADVLLDARDQFAILGPVRIGLLGQPLDNKSGVELADELRCKHPCQWSERELVFGTTLRLWRTGGISFGELNQSDIGLSRIRDFFSGKHRVYAGVLGRSPSEKRLSLMEMATSLASLRTEIERSHERAFDIDGATWERRERFVSMDLVAPDEIPEDYAARLEEEVGVGIPNGADHATRFAGLVDSMVDRGINPAEALVSTARQILSDPQLRPDYVVVTAARGVSLDRPWALDLTDVMSYAVVRRDYEPSRSGVRLDEPHIRSAIQQRMRYNVTCRGRNYSPDRGERLKAQPFQYADIARMEDAHHGGHIASGIRLVARAPFLVESSGVEQWRGLADLRINRASYDDRDSYQFEDLVKLIRYSRWCKAIVDAAYARRLLLDDQYCQKRVVETEEDGLGHAR